jgi:hypothetical protein
MNANATATNANSLPKPRGTVRFHVSGGASGLMAFTRSKSEAEPAG